MQRPEPTDAERAEKHIVSAKRFLYLLTVLKVFGFLNASRLLAPGAGDRALPPPPGVDPRNATIVLMLWYAAGAALCLVLARAIGARHVWARNLGYAFAALHVAGLIYVGTAGVPAIINGLLGLMLFVTLLLASGMGAFERTAAAREESG